MKKFILVLIIFISSINLSACKKSDDFLSLSESLSNYNIQINLNTDTHYLTASQSIDYINNTNSILKQIKLHIYPEFFEENPTNIVVSQTKLNEAYPKGINYADFNLTRLTIDNNDSSPVFEGIYEDILVVNLPNSLLPNERINIGLEYSISLPNCEHRFGYADDTINLANFYPIVCSFDDGKFDTSPYHFNGDPFYSDVANYKVNITLDDQYIVAGTGESSISYAENNLKNVYFEARIVRDFAMVISNKFELIENTINDTTVKYYYYNDINSNKSLQASTDALNTFNKLFGNYPYSTLSVVQCDFVHGGMEYPNLVMISDSIENHDDYENIIIHEIAHQWWYGMIGNNEYTYPWLDEALTEYSTILFYDYNEGYSLSHESMINSNHDNYSLFITVYEDVLGKIDTSMRAVDQYDTEPEYTYCTYVKGTLMYESLYQLIGEKSFIQGLQIYYKENLFKNCTPEDLISAFEESSNKDLSNFFSSWINGKVIIK